jgi:hypothetical protein
LVHEGELTARPLALLSTKAGREEGLEHMAQNSLRHSSVVVPEMFGDMGY